MAEAHLLSGSNPFIIGLKRVTIFLTGPSQQMHEPVDEGARPISWQKKVSLPLVLGDRRLTFQSRALIIRVGRYGAVVWNRPVSILEEQHDGEVRTIPVPDLTLALQFSFLALTLFMLAILWLFEHSSRGTK